MTVPERSGASRLNTKQDAGPSGLPSGPGDLPSDRLPVHPRPFGAHAGATAEALRGARAELADLAAMLRTR